MTASIEQYTCEWTSHFLFDRDKFTESTGNVAVKAYYPNKRYNCVSVICSDGLDSPSIWDIGDLYVAPTRGRSILARADLASTHIRAVGLRVTPDSTFPRHANIEGWPKEDKDKCKSLAQELRAEAKLVVKSADT